MTRAPAGRAPRAPDGPSARRATSGPLRIRRAVPADAAAVAATMRRSIRGLARESYGARALEAWSSLPALYHAWAMTAGGEAYVVAARAGRIVGYAALRGSELTAVFVLPGEARRGAGAALVRRIERDARRAGVRALRVRAALSAIAFYRAQGFRGGGRAVRVPLPGGVALAARALAKPLTGHSRPQGRRNGQRRQGSRAARGGKASSQATFRAGSARAARMAPIEARIASRQASRVAGSAATDTRSPPGAPFGAR